VHMLLALDNPATGKQEVWCSYGPNCMRIIDAETRKEILKFAEPHKKKITSMLQVGAEVWTAGMDAVVTCWSIESRKPNKTIKLKSPVSCMTLIEEDVWWMEDNKLCQVSAAKHKVLKEFKIDSFASCILYLPTTDEIWIGTARDIRILEGPKWTTRMVLEGHTDLVHDMQLVGSEVWSCSSDKSIRIWSQDGELQRTLGGHTSRIFHLLGLGIEYMVSCSWDTSLILWDAATYQFRTELKGQHKDAVGTIVGIKKNGHITQVWAGGWDGLVSVYGLNPPVMVPVE